LTAQHFDWAIFRDIPHSGLRFQSEVEGLRWSDVDWAESRFTVHEKKVEHHPGRGHRKSDTKSGTINARQEPSSLHDAREKSLAFVNNAKKHYPRQGFMASSVARGKRWFSKLTSLNPTLFQRRRSPLADDR
jgi:integrase